MKLVQANYLNLIKLDIAEFWILDSICKMSQVAIKDTDVFFQKNVFLEKNGSDLLIA